MPAATSTTSSAQPGRTTIERRRRRLVGRSRARHARRSGLPRADAGSQLTDNHRRCALSSWRPRVRNLGWRTAVAGTEASRPPTRACYWRFVAAGARGSPGRPTVKARAANAWASGRGAGVAWRFNGRRRRGALIDERSPCVGRRPLGGVGAASELVRPGWDFWLVGGHQFGDVFDAERGTVPSWRNLVRARNAPGGVPGATRDVAEDLFEDVVGDLFGRADTPQPARLFRAPDRLIHG